MRHRSVRMELVQVLGEEVDYRGRPEVGYAPANWARAMADALADREAWGGCPDELEGVSARSSDVLARWRKMTRVVHLRQARRATA
jgi:hypothetical protein